MAQMSAKVNTEDGVTHQTKLAPKSSYFSLASLSPPIVFFFFLQYKLKGNSLLLKSNAYAVLCSIFNAFALQITIQREVIFYLISPLTEIVQEEKRHIIQM